MEDWGELINCKVIIRDEATGRCITEATILDYDKYTYTISIRDHLLPLESSGRVSLLILIPNGLIECLGNVRKADAANTGYRLIALFNTKLKEDRGAARYPINTPARIEKVIAPDGSEIPVPQPLIVLVVNISTRGVLMQINVPYFTVNSVFDLVLNIAGSDTTIRTRVVRVFQSEDGLINLGCSFVSICS